MKILYLAHRIPYPPNKGDKIRSFHQVRCLTQKHQVDLLCLADSPADLKYQTDLAALCHRVAVFPLAVYRAKMRGALALLLGKSLSSRYFYDGKMQSLCDQWLAEQDYDAVVCFSSSMAEYVFNSGLMDSDQRPRLIMDFCDVDSDKWRQYAEQSRFPLDLLYRLEHERLAAYERRIQGTFDHSILVSADEAALFHKICPEADNLSVIPNGVDHDFFSSAAMDGHPPVATTAAAPVIVFTGAMDYHVNVSGVLWFVSEVWPLLRRIYPDLSFYVVGSNPADEIKELAGDDGITVTGFVEDIRDYYRLATLCVAPLHLGRGVQNKVLEAMAMGKAVVTTSRANAGVQGIHGDHLLVADTGADFCAAVERLLSDVPLRQQLGQAARDYVTAKFDWEKNMEQFERLLS